MAKIKLAEGIEFDLCHYSDDNKIAWYESTMWELCYNTYCPDYYNYYPEALPIPKKGGLGNEYSYEYRMAERINEWKKEQAEIRKKRVETARARAALLADLERRKELIRERRMANLKLVKEKSERKDEEQKQEKEAPEQQTEQKLERNPDNFDKFALYVEENLEYIYEKTKKLINDDDLHYYIITKENILKVMEMAELSLTEAIELMEAAKEYSGSCLFEYELLFFRRAKEKGMHLWDVLFTMKVMKVMEFRNVKYFELCEYKDIEKVVGMVNMPNFIKTLSIIDVKIRKGAR